MAIAGDVEVGDMELRTSVDAAQPVSEAVCDNGGESERN